MPIPEHCGNEIGYNAPLPSGSWTHLWFFSLACPQQGWLTMETRSDLASPEGGCSTGQEVRGAPDSMRLGSLRPRESPPVSACSPERLHRFCLCQTYLCERLGSRWTLSATRWNVSCPPLYFGRGPIGPVPWAWQQGTENVGVSAGPAPSPPATTSIKPPFFREKEKTQKHGAGLSRPDPATPGPEQSLAWARQACHHGLLRGGDRRHPLGKLFPRASSLGKGLSCGSDLPRI